MASPGTNLTLGAIAEVDLQGRAIPLFLLIDSTGKVSLVVGSRRFEFSQLPKGFKASYKDPQGKVNISELLGELIPSIADEIPGDLTLNLEQVTIAYQTVVATNKNSPKNNSAFLVSSRLGFDINLSEMPLIGEQIPADLNFGLKSFQVTYVSNELNKNAARAFASDLNINLDRFTDEKDIVLSSGINLAAELQLGDNRHFLSLPLSKPSKKQAKLTQPKLPQTRNGSNSSGNRAAPKKSRSLSTQDNKNPTELWLELDRKIGPIVFQKIGMQYRSKESELWFFLNASLSLDGLTLACNNLAVGSSIKEFKPKFSLDGISIHYHGSDFVEIGGAFLRKIRPRLDEDGEPKKDAQGQPIFYEEYSGGAIIGGKLKGKKITLTAIGSYTEINGEASLFVFALLDYPLGGPPFFFVTGFAAGFGYNRNLKIPNIEEVANFPLVRLAMGEPPSKSNGNAGKVDLLSVLDDLGPYIPPARDELFFAIGVKFTSFKLIDAFVLLIVKLGQKFEIHVLGLAVLTAPPSLSDDMQPLAQARLAIKAVFIPEDGILQVEASLTQGSYILSQDCVLTGGFAFYAWFFGDRAGEFVLTLGGYHPGFQIPDYYPRVPRVQLSWTLNKHLFIKGSTYFALTPSALMFGGELEASYRKGSIEAYYKLAAHFLVAWQPVFYTADASVEIRASAKIEKWGFRVTLNLHILAAVEIWGPPFSGRARFKAGPINVEIYFGDSKSAQPKALTWPEFKTSLLPAKEEVISIAIADGLVEKREEGKQEISIVNAKELRISAESAIPSSGENIGIRPMNVQAKDFDTQCHVSIFRGESSVDGEFKCEPISKNVPAAVWKSSPSFRPQQQEDPLVKNAPSGFEIKPKSKSVPGQTQTIDYDALLSQPDRGNQYDWSPIHQLKTEAGCESSDNISDNIKNLEQLLEKKTNKERRQQLIDSLNIPLECQPEVSQSFAEELLGEPILMSGVTQ